MITNPSEIPKPVVEFFVEEDVMDGERLVRATIQNEGRHVDTSVSLVNDEGVEVFGHEIGEEYLFFLRDTEYDQRWDLTVVDPIVGSSSSTELFLEGRPKPQEESDDVGVVNTDDIDSVGCSSSSKFLSSWGWCFFIVCFLMGRKASRPKVYWSLVKK